MFRVTAVATASDQQLNRLIKRLALLFVVGVIAFTAFYVLDRFRLPQPTIVSQEMAALEESVRTTPDDIAARGRLADVYLAAGRNEDAIAQYTAILETGKADKPAYLGRGRAYEASGNLAAAAADYGQIVAMAKDGEMARVDPMLQAAYYGLGSIALEEGRSADAVGLLSSALDINRADADALYLIGRAYTATGETDKAIASLRRAIAFVPIGWAEPYTALADAYTAAGDAAHATWATAMGAFVNGDIAVAKASLEPLVGGGATVDAAIGLGLIAETEGDTGTAGSWYRQALAADPQNPAAALGLKRVGSGAAPSQMPALPNPGELGGNGS